MDVLRWWMDYTPNYLIVKDFLCCCIPLRFPPKGFDHLGLVSAAITYHPDNHL